MPKKGLTESEIVKDVMVRRIPVPTLNEGVYNTNLATYPKGRPVKIALGLPFYNGPDEYTWGEYFTHQNYYGRLMERSLVRGALEKLPDGLPPLDASSKTGLAELLPEDPPVEFMYVHLSGYSLMGQAREKVVDMAIEGGADYIFFHDDDIVFAKETLMRLLRHQKAATFALCFTSREPAMPVIYKLKRIYDDQQGWALDIVWRRQFPEDALFRVDASGSGVMLVHTSVFKTIPKPWFSSTGMGEDIQFAVRCQQWSVPLYCDSSIWTAHKPASPHYWIDLQYYKQQLDVVKKFEQSELTRRFMERLDKTEGGA